MHHDVFFPLGISIRSLDNGRPRTTGSEDMEVHLPSEEEAPPSTRTPSTDR